VAFRQPLIQNWPETVVRLFGVLHFLYGSVALYLFVGAFSIRVFSKPVDPSTPYPYEMHAYALRIAVNAIFIAGLFVAGVLLVRARHLGVVLSNFLFGCMIVYLMFPYSFFLSEGFNRSMAVTAAMNAPMMPVVFTGYFLLCWIVLNLARRRLFPEEVAPN